MSATPLDEQQHFLITKQQPHAGLFLVSSLPTMMDTSRKDKKAEGRIQKRQRIEEAGGVRPRKEKRSRSEPANEGTFPASHHRPSSKPNPTVPSTNPAAATVSFKKYQPGATVHGRPGRPRFGRVMDQAPCPNVPRFSTLSIALPGSVVSNCQTRELKTQLVGQIARAATIYHVDEIIVFDDKLSSKHPSHHGGYQRRHHQSPNGARERSGGPGADADNKVKPTTTSGDAESSTSRKPSSDPHTFMARVLQYCECPQYLRRHFFPMHEDLQFAGLLPPMDAPHHVRADDRSPYREGVVIDTLGPHGGSLVNCGIRNRPIEIDARLTPGIRCTLQLEPSVYTSKNSRGTVVSPAAPRERNGTYWGYTTRLASSLKAVWEECPFDGGYDVKIGTSERGRQLVDNKSYSVPNFQHCLIVFGGVAGIEECVDADESLKVSGSMSYTLFDQWVNVCPYQGSRTIRTEEAVLISLAKLSPLLAAGTQRSEDKKDVQSTRPKAEEIASLPQVNFSEDEPSEESGSSDED